MPVIRGGVACAACVAASLVVLAASSSSAAGPTKRDCVSANENAQDLRRGGRLREARAQFSLCVAASCPRAVRDDCAQGLAEIAGAMPHIVLAIRDADGHPVAPVTVVMDGVPVVDALDGAPIEVDPGAHRLRFTAAGFLPFEESVVVDEGDRERHVDVVLQAPAPVAQPAPAAPPSPLRASSGERGRQLAFGLAVGGGGVAFLVAGGVLAAVAKSTYVHAIDTECHGNANTCTAQGASDGTDAHVDAAAATVALVAGAALVAAGAVLVLTLPGGGHATVGGSVGNHDVGVALRGEW
jgi:hypothetical protein